MSAKKRDRRVWTAEEETLLVDILYHMNNTGWKVDTGYKSGYLPYIEKEVLKKLPNIDIKANPHIRSKMKVLKKQLSYVLEIQQYGSRFGWDDEHKMVTGDKDIFMGWAKSRDGAAALWMKPVIHYDKLVEIYANDLAKGSKVKGLGDQSNMDEDHVNVDVGNQVMDETASQTQSTPPLGFKTSFKRKFSDNDGIESELISATKSIKAFLEGQSQSSVQPGSSDGDKMKRLFDLLRTLPGLSPEEIMKATHLIGQDRAKMNLFFAVPDDFKLIFARQEIDGSN